MTLITTTQGNVADKLPVSALLALAVAGFITILTEALPAGMLAAIADSLRVTPALAGQLVTVYAVGSLLAAIPLTLATQTLRRRPLLLSAIAGFAVANTVTALSEYYLLTLAARFVAGVSAGLLWALLAGYAARMVNEAMKGRAIALAMVGTPLALAVGIPLGTWMGEVIGWRSCFLTISALTLLLTGWILHSVPDFSGQPAQRRQRLIPVLKLPGVRPILLVTLIFVLAHNILYTYIFPFLERANMAGSISGILLTFGLTSLLGIGIVGARVDRWLRGLSLLATALFALSAVLMTSALPWVIYTATGLWGLAFGGAATLFQTALAKSAGDAADIAQSMLVTAWNLAIAGGGLTGAAILHSFGAGYFPPVILSLLLLTALIVMRAKQHGFPPADSD